MSEPSLLLTSIILTPCSSVSIVNFEHTITGWAQPAITYSRLTIETLEQCVKYN